MAEQKTKPTTVDVKKFLDGVADPQRREDAFVLLKMMKEITGAPPRMWGPSMVGFGSYHYIYASGHEGDIFLTGFAPRKNALVLYLMSGLDEHFSVLLEKLGKSKASKGCLYIKKLADVDLDVLRTMIEKNIARLNTMCEAGKTAARAKKNRKK